MVLIGVLINFDKLVHKYPYEFQVYRNISMMASTKQQKTLTAQQTKTAQGSTKHTFSIGVLLNKGCPHCKSMRFCAVDVCDVQYRMAPDSLIF